jgi:hypothetical protein
MARPATNRNARVDRRSLEPIAVLPLAAVP